MPFIARSGQTTARDLKTHMTTLDAMSSEHSPRGGRTDPQGAAFRSSARLSTADRKVDHSRRSKIRPLEGWVAGAAPRCHLPTLASDDTERSGRQRRRRSRFASRSDQVAIGDPRHAPSQRYALARATRRVRPVRKLMREGRQGTGTKCTARSSQCGSTPLGPGQWSESAIAFALAQTSDLRSLCGHEAPAAPRSLRAQCPRTGSRRLGRRDDPVRVSQLDTAYHEGDRAGESWAARKEPVGRRDWLRISLKAPACWR